MTSAAFKTGNYGMVNVSIYDTDEPKYYYGTVNVSIYDTDEPKYYYEFEDDDPGQYHGPFDSLEDLFKDLAKTIFVPV